MKALHYSDINLIPQKCIVDSRKECDTTVILGKNLFQLPIIPANMKSVVKEETCIYLAEKEIFYIMHRFNSNIINFIEDMNRRNLITSISIGINEDSYNIINEIQQKKLKVDYITIDVANAWSEKCQKMVRNIKDKLPDTFLIVGNVATHAACRAIQDWGADAIKIGIACGCFIAGTLIKTREGLKAIEDIQIGDEVYTHNNRCKKVIATSQRIEGEKLIEINKEINCTPNHRFYVVHKRYENLLTDENIDNYAEWIPAEELNEDFYLLKNKEG